MANEPSLSEISNMRVDPELGGGSPVPVIDNSKTVENLNQAARFHAENQWRKYNQFLQNKKDLFQNISDIQGLETLPEDKEYLHKQAGDILSEILKNPSVIAGGKGYSDVQAKIAKFKSDAMASKASALDEKANKMFLDRNPDLYTDENVKAIEANKKLPIEQRKSVLLKMPTILDEKTLFESALKNSTNPFSEVTDANGKKGEGYIQTGVEVNPKALQEQMNLSLEGQKDKYGHSIKNAVETNFKQLPEDVQKQYEEKAKQNKTDPLTEYWKYKTGQYLKAYAPEGSYELTPNGNYRFIKSIKADPSYLNAEKLNLERQKLAEKAAYDRQRIAIGLGNLGISREKLNKTNAEDQDGAATVINEAVNTIKNGTPITVVDAKGNKHQEIRISDPALLKTFEGMNGSNTKEVPNAMRYNPKTNQITLIYAKRNVTGGYGEMSNTHEKEIPLDERTWLKNITKRSFPNKDIGGINSLIETVLQKNNGSLYEVSQKSGKQQDQEQVDLSSLDPKGFKKEGNNYRYKDGRLFDANGNLIKGK